MSKLFFTGLEINKLRKFYAGIFSFSEAKIFSIAGLWSKFLMLIKVKRASKMRRLLFAKCLTLSLSFLLVTNLFSQEEKNQITYIANEGVMIEYQGKKVLIDALHKSDIPLYQFTRNPFPYNMINGKTPFEGVDLFLITHLHGDHFSPTYMKDFLTEHEETILIAPEQVIDTMEHTGLATQIYSLRGTDKGLMYEMDGIKIHALPLIHSYPQKNAWIDNMAYFLDFDGLTILHAGDAEFLPENLKRIQRVIGKRVDYILLPDWYFEDKETIAQVRNKIKAKKYIAMHVMVTEPGTYERRLKKLVKDFKLDLNVFMRIGEIELLEK
ncbi:MAG: MBL fold metallo-hydrolase [Saprospiraceae bacterium]